MDAVVANNLSSNDKFGSPVLGSSDAGSQLRYRGKEQPVLPGSPDSGVDHDLSARSSLVDSLGEDSTPKRDGDGTKDSDASDCEQEAAAASSSSSPIIEKLRSLYPSAVARSEAAAAVGKRNRGATKQRDTAIAVLVAVVMLSSCAFTLLMMTRGMAVKSATSEAGKAAMYAERNGKYASMAFAAASANNGSDVANAVNTKKPDDEASEPPVKDEDDPFRFRKIYF